MAGGFKKTLEYVETVWCFTHETALVISEMLNMGKTDHSPVLNSTSTVPSFITDNPKARYIHTRTGLAVNYRQVPALICHLPMVVSKCGGARPGVFSRRAV
jgi:hypothetical protein